MVDLSAGEPTYGTPAYAAEAGIAAIRAGHTGYPPTPGIPALRRAVAEYLDDTTSHPLSDPTTVLVGAGVKQALFNCIFCLFGPGDEVMVPAPYWPTYPTMVELAGARPVVVETAWENEFRLEVDALEALRTERTRGLLLNSPGNPTGEVYSLKLLADLLAWAGEHDIWVLSDEIYRRLHFGRGPAPSVFDVADRPERVVLLDGPSKAFCMTGWRIGYAVGPRELIAKATDLQSQTTSGAVTPSQHAAAAALGQRKEREESIRTLLGRLEETRAQGYEALAAMPGLEIRPPAGSIFFYVRLAGSTPSMEVAESLLMEGEVAVIPGEPFGSPGHLRLNFAVESETLEAGLDRMRSFFENGL